MMGVIRRSFKTRIFVTVAMVALVPLLVCVLLMVPLLVRQSESAMSSRANRQLKEVRSALTVMTGEMRQSAEALAGSQTVLDALQGKVEEQALYTEMFAANAHLRDYARLGLYDAKGRCCWAVNGASMDAMDVEWGVLLAAARNQTLSFAVDDTAGFVAARAIYADTGEVTGYLVFRVENQGFDALFAGRYDTASNVLLLDDHWRMVYHSQPAQGETTAALLREEMLAGKQLGAEDDEFCFYVDAGASFTLVLQQPKTFTNSVLRTFYLVASVTCVLCLVLCLWGAWMLSRLLSQPVRDLSHAMGEVERGDFDVRLQTDRQDELGRLSNSFNHMVAECQDYLTRSVQKQKELNEAQMRMMQAQLNPHFLYNTLDSVKWMAVEHDAPQIANLVTDLAGLLRAAISEGEFITLQQELELVERYIDVQSLRFNDSFTCEIAVAEEFQRCMVPKLVLQPLVENAIIHGVANREDGYIKLWAEETDGDLTVVVSDNGVGMSSELVEQLNHGERRVEGGHLGLNNVNSILRLHYGEQYGITAESQTGRGSRVSVRLPLQRKESARASSIDCRG